MFKEFINDDHDHAISVTSLSVQIYTVPTIAHKLIEEHDALFQIMRTFLSEFEQKYSTGKEMSSCILHLIHNRHDQDCCYFNICICIIL